MQIFMKAIALLAIILGVIWFIAAPDFEPVITTLMGLLTLIGLYFNKEKKQDLKPQITQSQQVNNNSTGTQAGGSINITTSKKG